jgi:hypothetical protein
VIIKPGNWGDESTKTDNNGMNVVSMFLKEKLGPERNRF